MYSVHSTHRTATLIQMLVGICLLLGLVWSCAPEKVAVEAPPPDITPTGEALFASAEALYEAQSYNEALAVYQQYLARFPDGPLAEATRVKIGNIHFLLGNTAQSREAFQQLITLYPQSPFKNEALVVIAETLYQEGRYKEVIRHVQDIPMEVLMPDQRVRLFRLIGDTFMALDSQLEAAYYYIRSYPLVTDVDRETIRFGLQEALRQLTREDIELLAKELPTPELQGLLWHQFGQSRIANEMFDEALDVLNMFVERFPGHAAVPEARRQIEAIERSVLRRPYKIGCLLPLSGPYEIYGQRALKGIELAFSQHTAGKQLPDIQIVVRDSRSDPDIAAKIVAEFERERVAAILGPIVAAESAALEAQMRFLPILTFTQKDYIAEIGDYVFRNFITPRMQVEAIVRFAVQKLGLRRFAVLYPDENYGRRFMNHFWDEVIAEGGVIVGAEAYPIDATDFADSIKRLVGLYYKVPEDLKENYQWTEFKTPDPTRRPRPMVDLDEIFTPPVRRFAGADVALFQDAPYVAEGLLAVPKLSDEPEPIVDFDAIFIPDAPKMAGLIIPQLAFYDIEDVYLLGTNLWHSPNLIRMARDYVQNAILVDGFYAQSRKAQVQEFVKAFEATYGETPGFIEATTYDTAMILFQVLDQNDIRFRSGLKETLKQIPAFPGVTGLTAFTASGEADKQLYLLRVKGSRFVELENP